MIHILLTLLPIFGIMGLGAFAERRQMLPHNTAACMNQFVYWFSLPLLLFHQMARIRPEQIAPSAAAGFVLGIAVAYGLSFALQKVMKEESRVCFIVAMVGTFPNAAFMGLPIIFLLLPDNPVAAVAAGLAVVLTSAPMLFTDTVLALGAGRQRTEDRGKPRVGALRMVGASLVHNPVMICTALGAAAGLSGCTLPDALMTTARMVGSTAAPCALFCMGMTLSAQVGAKAGKPLGMWQRQLPMNIFKLALTPLLVFGISWLLGERGISLGTITIMASMPTAVVGYIIAEKYDAAAQDSSTAIVLNTLLSALTIPVIILLLYWGKVLPLAL